MSKPLKPFLKTEQVLMTEQERIEYLEDLIERGKGLSDTEIVAFYGDYTPREPRGTSKTAQALLLMRQGIENRYIVDLIGSSYETIKSYRKRFKKQGLL